MGTLRLELFPALTKLRWTGIWLASLKHIRSIEPFTELLLHLKEMMMMINGGKYCPTPH